MKAIGLAPNELTLIAGVFRPHPEIRLVKLVGSHAKARTRRIPTWTSRSGAMWMQFARNPSLQSWMNFHFPIVLKSSLLSPSNFSHCESISSASA